MEHILNLLNLQAVIEIPMVQYYARSFFSAFSRIRHSPCSSRYLIFCSSAAYNAALYGWVRDGSFQLLTQPQVLEETRLLMEHLDSPGSVFRMNHASNYLVLKGTLNRDKEAMLRTIDAAEHDLSRLRPEEWRGL